MCSANLFSSAYLTVSSTEAPLGTAGRCPSASNAAGKTAAANGLMRECRTFKDEHLSKNLMFRCLVPSIIPANRVDRIPYGKANLSGCIRM